MSAEAPETAPVTARWDLSDDDDYVDDVKDVMSRVRHRDFPVLGSNGNYVGMISRRNLMNMQKKQIILVDHNEKSQEVDKLIARIKELLKGDNFSVLCARCR